MPYTVVPTRAGGYAPQESDWDTYIRDNINSGWAFFGKTDPNGATAALTFQSIPQTMKHLRFVFYARTEASATFADIAVRLNNDVTAGNYDKQELQGSGAVASAAELIGGNNINRIPGNLAVANSFSVGILEIPNYSVAGNHKAVIWTLGTKFNNATNSLRMVNGALFWRNTAAVTSIDIVAASFISVGSRISCYGSA